MPPMPNAKPKKRPETAPTLPGISSWANTTIAEKAEDNMSPMRKLKMPVHMRSTNGSANVNGDTPAMENQMTRRRPIRSPM